ncbi:MAG: class I tRNA ligase family protein, partial [Erysipelotrichaceae bacterium]
IVSKLNYIINQTTMNLDRYEFAIAGNELINFVWNDFCSSYIEFTKSTLLGDDEEAKKKTLNTLIYVLTAILKLLHPFIPFVTEEIYQAIYGKKVSICKESWPEIMEADEVKASNIDSLNEVIKTVRDIKTENNIKPSKEIKLEIEGIEFSNDIKEILFKMCKAICTEIIEGEKIVRPINNAKLYFKMDEIVNKEEELLKIEKELNRLEGEIKRSNAILSNPKFVDKAPKEKVEDERNKLKNYQASYDALLQKKKELL